MADLSQDGGGAHTYIPNIWEVEAAGSWVQGHSISYRVTLYIKVENKNQPTNQLTNQSNPKIMTKRCQPDVCFHLIISLIRYLQYYEIRAKEPRGFSLSCNYYFTLGCKPLQARDCYLSFY